MGPQTQTGLNRIKALFDNTRKDEWEPHYKVMQRLYEHIGKRTEKGDFDESKYYEAWDAILNHFRILTNTDITIAPQRRFKRNFYDEKEPGV